MIRSSSIGLLLWAGQALAQPYQQPWLNAELKLQLTGVSEAQWQAGQPELKSWLEQQQQRYHKPDQQTQLQWQQRCEQLREQMQQAVSCRLGAAEQQWQQAVQQNQLPDRVALRQHSRQLNKLPAADTQIQWSYQGIARAELAQQLTARVQQLWPQAQSYSFSLAGLQWYQGPEQQLELGDAELQQLKVKQLFLAQAPSASGYRVAHRTYSSVLNPADGWPVEYGPAATISASDLVQAWALAQSLAVLPAEQGLKLSDAQHAGALLQSDQGQLQASKLWYAQLAADNQRHSRAMDIRYLLPEFAADARRPYVSVWLADEKQQLVRQIELSGQQQRWWQELRHWWRKQARKAPEQFDSLAGATHKAGWQQLQWDGRDQQGQVVPAGHYWLHLEIAREHGGHQHLKWPVQWQADLPQQHHQLTGELSAIEWHLAE